MSTFHGLEMAKQSLFTQQSALHTTGHNISNANTQGYSRQRVNFETMSASPPPSRNRPEMAGQLGTGVQAGSIERVRNAFLDSQYRSNSSQSSYWEAKSNALDRLERLMNEPTDTGIASGIEKFRESLQELSASPTNDGAKSVVAQRGQTLADILNYTADTTESIREDLKMDIGQNVNTVNNLIADIDHLNDSINEVEIHGDLPNDLYDKRDHLIDELAGIVDIDVTKPDSTAGATPAQEGIVSIAIADTGLSLLDAGGTVNKLNVSFDGNQGAVAQVTAGTQNVLGDLTSNGKLKGMIDTYGYMENDEVSGSFTEFQADLNKMAASLGEVFNDIHDEPPFFTVENNNNTAGTITVSDEIIDKPEQIMTSEDGYGDIASDLAGVFSKEISEDEGGLGDTSIHSFFEGLIGGLGVEAQKANTMKANTKTLQNQVEEQRMSVSSVSLDEEMSNMIKFQHAYNAAARGMTAVDEMLDRIINNMGLVGR